MLHCFSTKMFKIHVKIQTIRPDWLIPIVVRMTPSSEYDNLDNPFFIYKIVKSL